MSHNILQFTVGYDIVNTPGNLRRMAIAASHITAVHELLPNAQGQVSSGHAHIYLTGSEEPFSVWETYDEVLTMWAEALSE